MSSSHARQPDVKFISDISYGAHKKQTLDVYIPANAQNAPVIFMVHGGAWRIGDKGSKSVVKNKVSHWVAKGFIFISVNYRMLPDVKPLRQAADVKKALHFAQKNITTWGGSPSKFILMGHSAGAHLVSLLASNEKLAKDVNLLPWLGTIALDSAAYNVVTIMEAKRPPFFYKKAFGENKTYWEKTSPLYSLSNKTPPFLAVCSQKRKDDSCAQAQQYVNKAQQLGTKATLLPIDLSHRKINTQLGKNISYTKQVDAFLKTLHPSISALLTK